MLRDRRARRSVGIKTGSPDRNGIAAFEKRDSAVAPKTGTKFAPYGPPPPFVAHIVKWCVSPSGDKVITKSGYGSNRARCSRPRTPISATARSYYRRHKETDHDDRHPHRYGWRAQDCYPAGQYEPRRELSAMKARNLHRRTGRSLLHQSSLPSLYSALVK
ncbi:hypothetical protein NL676_031309 [Syzygium grande]|nr:hypothetical protein NL676_031309 [Syzygium grande]